MTEAQVRAEEAEDQARRDADRRWRERLRQWWRDYVALKDPQARSESVAALAPSLEPRAVPTIVSLFAKGDAEQQLAEVRLLDRIDAPEASQELARLAVVGRDDAVRSEADGAIARRDTTDAIEWLIGSLHDPLRIDVQSEPGAVGVLEVEDEDGDPPQDVPAAGGPVADREERRVPGWIIGALPDVGRPERSDGPPEARSRRRGRPESERAAGVDQRARRRRAGHGHRPGLRGGPRHLAAVVVGRTRGPLLPDLDGTTSRSSGGSAGPRSSSRPSHGRCFAKGTLVRTVLGPRPIEGLQVGDRVLTSDVTTGALEVRPVVAVRHNPPSPTLRLTLGSESVVATPIHRFWKSGTGWVMARDLKPGDAVRAIDGVVRVVATEPDAVQPVYQPGSRGRPELLRRRAGRPGARLQPAPAGDRRVRRRPRDGGPGRPLPGGPGRPPEVAARCWGRPRPDEAGRRGGPVAPQGRSMSAGGKSGDIRAGIHQRSQKGD